MKIKSAPLSTLSPEVMEPDAMIFSFLNVEFYASFFTLLFHPYQEALWFLVTFYHLVSSAYLRLLIFLQAVLIPACDWSSLAFGMMYSVCMRAKSLQSCSTLLDPMDCSPPGSSVHGTLQARVMEWVTMPSSRGSSWPRDWSWISLFLLHWQVDSLPLVPSGKPYVLCF